MEKGEKLRPLPSVEDIERIIFRMSRTGYAPGKNGEPQFVLYDYSARELAIAIRDMFKGTAFNDVRTIVVHRSSVA